MKSHLVIGDAHCKPGTSTRRFELAGRLAVDKRPDVIIDMGDWFDMPSLCSYDKGRASFNGRAYAADIKAGRDAREAFLRPIKQHNAANPRSPYEPRLVALGGNHCEGRLKRVLSLESWLEGTLTMADFGHEEYGFEYVPYREVKVIDGISYSHCFASGVMGRPIAGEHPAYTLLAKLHTSTTAGHLHLFDYCERTDAVGKKICGMIAGCFFDHNEAYAGPQVNKLWWRGLVICKDVRNGYYDIDRYSLDKLRQNYAD